MPGREWSGELLEAYSKGLDQELTRPADEHLTATVKDTDATHDVLPEEPAAVAVPVPGPVV
ncbi:hypothetical protein ACWDZ6_09635 [Streptomyces sp. NPDC002926]